MVLIKKYGNRRLYDTERSGYINLEDLARLVREGHDVKVVDASSGEDLTQDVLLQVVLEVLRGVDLLPVGILKRIIRSTSDDPMQVMIRGQLSTGLELLAGQLDRMEAMLGMGRREPPPPEPAPEPAPPEPPPPASEPRAGSEDAGLDALRERLAALEERLSRS